jgi:hypothetical protein
MTAPNRLLRTAALAGARVFGMLATVPFLFRRDGLAAPRLCRGWSPARSTSC